MKLKPKALPENHCSKRPPKKRQVQRSKITSGYKELVKDTAPLL